MPSPTPTNSKGTAFSFAIAHTTPPLAVPSSFVRISPVSPRASSKAFTWASEFWPVLASSTSSTSCGAPSSALAVTRFTLRISSIRCSCVGSRPAVSAISTSAPRARAAPRASNTTALGAPQACPITRTWLRAPRAPRHRRLAGSSPERVARVEDHAAALGLQPLGELADRGGLAGAVHTGHHDDERLRAGDFERPLQRREQRGYRLLERLPERFAVLELLFSHRRDQLPGGGDAAIGLQQRGLELLEQRLVDLAPREELGDRRVENVARARKTSLEARGPGERYHECVHSNKGKVRIIAGQYRGRRIAVPDRDDLRPTPDRVRETLFNWLGQDLSGRACLDLFAGSGALGFEAASRGASRVVMVENDRVAISALQASLKTLDATSVELVRADAFEYLRASGERFDVVFLDPPFRQNALPGLLDALPARLASGARVYVEAPAPCVPDDSWRELKRSRAGQVSYQLLERR